MPLIVRVTMGRGSTIGSIALTLAANPSAKTSIVYLLFTSTLHDHYHQAFLVKFSLRGQHIDGVPSSYLVV